MSWDDADGLPVEEDRVIYAMMRSFLDVAGDQDEDEDERLAAERMDEVNHAAATLLAPLTARQRHGVLIRAIYLLTKRWREAHCDEHVVSELDDFLLVLAGLEEA